MNYIGKDKTLMTFSTIITVGQFICACGGWIGNFTMLVVGRCIHGMGSESQQMVNAVYVASWFKDQEISFAMGVSQMTLLFSFLGGWLIPKIARYSGIGNAFAFGAVCCLFSFFVSLALVVLDNWSTKKDRQMWHRRRQAM